MRYKARVDDEIRIVGSAGRVKLIQERPDNIWIAKTLNYTTEKSVVGEVYQLKNELVFRHYKEAK